MNFNGNRVLLQHDLAQHFFYESLHPDADELQRRDLFISEIERECSYRDDGNDLVAEIPDIDLNKTFPSYNIYQSSYSFLFSTLLSTTIDCGNWQTGNKTESAIYLAA